jgi:foldase protein PrsA
VRITRGIAALILIAILGGALAACSEPTAEAVARVNGEDITREEFDRIYAQVATQFGGEIPEDQAVEYRKLLLDMMIESALIRQEAERLGADLSDEAVEEGLSGMMGETTDMAEFEARVVEAGLTMEDLRSSIRDDLAQQFLSAHVASLQGDVSLPETYALLEHILVDEEQLALDLLDRIGAGEDFAELAAEFSTDPGSGAAGGSLGWAPTSAYVAEFKDAADALGVGELSQPVQSEFGWHIIRKVDEVAAGTPVTEAPEELRAEVEASGANLALQEYVADLKGTAEIEYLDDALAP